MRSVGAQSSNMSSENEPLARFATTSTTSHDSNLRAGPPPSEEHSQTLLQLPSIQMQEDSSVTPSTSVMLHACTCIAPATRFMAQSFLQLKHELVKVSNAMQYTFFNEIHKCRCFFHKACWKMDSLYRITNSLICATSVSTTLQWTKFLLLMFIFIRVLFFQQNNVCV